MGRHIVVGVEPDEPAVVLRAAAEFARRFDAHLVCAYADPTRFVVQERDDGTVLTLPIDPDLADAPREGFDPGLAAHISAILAPTGVRWDTRYVVGTPADALAALADELDAEMIVLGSREPGVRASFREFVNGSIAARLSHRQHRPVVVVPVSPAASDRDLPWREEV